MTDATALLQSILSDPADDHRRLLYADHLDECGEGERAEFVRIQVELSRKIGGGRCYACQWPVDDNGHGCRRDGDCSYRPSKHNPDYERWLSRMHEISEFRRRERELLLYNPWPQWFYLPKNRDGYFLNGFGFETQNQQGIGITPRRGFVASIRLSWSDWLRHHESLYWHPKQTVECAICEGRGFNTYPNHACHACQTTDPDTQCSVSTGRIPRPFVATAHPITRAELTTWPCEPMTGVNATAIGAREYTFNRVKCPECGGRGLVNAANGPIVEGDPIYQCPACRGNHLNEWHCDQWPTITFVMPDSR